MQGEDLEFRRKTLKKIQELQCQLTPTQTASTTSKNKDSVAMEINTMLQGEQEKDEEDSPKANESLFFMDPDH